VGIACNVFHYFSVFSVHGVFSLLEVKYWRFYLNKTRVFLYDPLWVPSIREECRHIHPNDLAHSTSHFTMQAAEKSPTDGTPQLRAYWFSSLHKMKLLEFLWDSPACLLSRDTKAVVQYCLFHEWKWVNFHLFLYFSLCCDGVQVVREL